MDQKKAAPRTAQRQQMARKITGMSRTRTAAAARKIKPGIRRGSSEAGASRSAATAARRAATARRAARTGG